MLDKKGMLAQEWVLLGHNETLRTWLFYIMFFDEEEFVYKRRFWMTDQGVDSVVEEIYSDRSVHTTRGPCEAETIVADLLKRTGLVDTVLMMNMKGLI